MRRTHFAIAFAAVLLAPAAAYAQTGAELVGTSVQVETAGVLNTIYFDAGGVARIITPGGNTIPATWAVSGGQLCLGAGGAQECVPYASALPPGQPVTLTSSCQNVSTWTAAGQALPPPQPGGERG